MKRRDAIKKVAFGIGYVAATPTIMSILSSCSNPADNWEPLFLTSEQKNLITHLCDIILPSSSIPGAIEVNVPQFIDKMMNDIETDSTKKSFKNGADLFANKLEQSFGVNVLTASRGAIKELFESYFRVSEEEEQIILQEQNKNKNQVPKNYMETYLVYKFLLKVRSHTMLGYFTSEKVGTEVLNYDPVPGSYEGCVPLENIGNSWSL